jgi:hypothetical protein
MKRREFIGLAVMKISRSYRRGLFLPGGFLALILYPCRLDAQLDRLTEARGNEVGFRAFPQQFQRG